MRLGLIGRCDDGGLGTLTTEFARHLRVERCLIVDLGNNSRGGTQPERIKNIVPDARMSAHPVSDEALKWLVDGLDVVYTAETPYNNNLYKIASEVGCRVVLHAMPELLKPEYEAHEVWLPTTWHESEIPHSRVIPIPIATERFTYRQRTEAKTFLHIPGVAMLDRNGTDLVMSAALKVKTECRIIIAGSKMRTQKRGVVTVEGSEHSREYWNNYADDVDVLLMPRRYGGLCLPTQEAAACGIPSLMLGIEPQTSWPGFRVDSFVQNQARMAGGKFDVSSTMPEMLADEIDAVCRKDISIASEAARSWAATLDWSRWADVYTKCLAGLT